MLLTERMKEDIFSVAEQSIIHYLFEEREKVKTKTLEHISKVTYTHPSTVIRIAKKLGYDGWLELKEHFLEEVEYLNRHYESIDANFPFDAADNNMSISHKLALLNQTTINDTLHLINNQALDLAVDYLVKADTIKIFGLYHNLMICEEFEMKMNQIGKTVKLCTLEPHFEIEKSTKDTCAIFISYSGENQSILKLLPMLKKKKVPIIGLTSIGENTVSKYADSTLRISTREKLYSKISNFSTRDSIGFLMDILYACVYGQDYEQHTNYKINIAKNFDHRVTHNKMIQENQ
ncbi:MurR/RpiR family transcriptional regulator [Mammaliicoccus fleurettii]|uniref:MurR/RpiR family transcriptional regulator n=1 Tax=Mammaliicoccus fleurettii TaxID=150056 RepID=UPI000DFB8F8F|nr:MurR/RpiR family transcriptional regulator [Mammaliicoccus fleurettii]RTX88596.1 MurR/RpiR family transcriptional regulator [Mammaliicoccus fleurettii]SUM37572.1 putative RpiR family transcriptional regulator [Mammaliicoccus fleurettii]HCN61638.1 MurR/RpiR family transcriptional regulator [Staphylococcus sp.]